jgi:hypothetical protein
LLAQLGTSLWRMRQKMLCPSTNQPREELGSVWSHFEAAWGTLTDAGFQIQDHTGEPFDSGRDLKTLAFEPTANLTRETVIETIRPSIFFRDQRIQLGEVIVGTPTVPSCESPPPVAPPTTPASAAGEQTPSPPPVAAAGSVETTQPSSATDAPTITQPAGEKTDVSPDH